MLRWNVFSNLYVSTWECLVDGNSQTGSHSTWLTGWTNASGQGSTQEVEAAAMNLTPDFHAEWAGTGQALVQMWNEVSDWVVRSESKP